MQENCNNLIEKFYNDILSENKKIISIDDYESCISYYDKEIKDTENDIRNMKTKLKLKENKLKNYEILKLKTNLIMEMKK